MSHPGIPRTEFTPRPQAVHAQWGTAVRMVTGLTLTDEVMDLGDIEINDEPVPWLFEEGTGVAYARIRSPLGFTLAIARAVPLS